MGHFGAKLIITSSTQSYQVNITPLIVNFKWIKFTLSILFNRMIGSPICAHRNSKYCYVKYHTSTSKQIHVKLTSQIWQFNLLKLQIHLTVKLTLNHYSNFLNFRRENKIFGLKLHLYHSTSSMEVFNFQFLS